MKSKIGKGGICNLFKKSSFSYQIDIHTQMHVLIYDIMWEMFEDPVKIAFENHEILIFLNPKKEKGGYPQLTSFKQ